MPQLHPIFDPASMYNRLRRPFQPQEKLKGFFHWRRLQAERVIRPASIADCLAASDRFPVKAGIATPAAAAAAPNPTPPHTSVFVCESLDGQPVLRKPASAAVIELRIRRSIREQQPDRLTIDVNKLPHRNVPCRVFLIEAGVVEHLREACLGLAAKDDPEVLERAFADECLGKDLEVARILSAVPDLDGEVNRYGYVHIEAQVPAGTPGLDDRVFVVLVVGDVATPPADAQV